MKIKSITLSVVAALYATGVGAAAADANLNGDSSAFRNIEITDAIVKYNEHLRSGKDRAGGNQTRPTSNGQNVHRGISVTGDDKIPFQFEQGVTGEHIYIVELSDQPAALYQGNIAGLQATNPRHSSVPALLAGDRHGKLDSNSNAVQNYRQYLTQKQDDVVSKISAMTGNDASIKARYTLAFNGMASKMTQEQAAQIAALPGVKQVSRDQVYELHTDVGPWHIGADGIWNGETADLEYKGEGVVVGVIDTGINTDHSSFAAVSGDGYVHTLPSRYEGYVGDCELEEFADLCNDKLIGVRSYPVITDSYADPAFQPDVSSWQVEAKRPANGEDYNGHGSHTASTAAGNVQYDVDYLVPDFGEMSDGIPTGLKFPVISGVAPRANIIMYQGCYPGDGSYGDGYRGCPGAALIASIEDAIADGVDVINYSIGTTFGAFPWESPTELAFLAARESGISVSASAGNSYSPAYPREARGAIDHLSPWLTSVAATTHGREINVDGKMLTGFTGGAQTLEDVEGGGITESYTGPVVRAKDYGSEYEKCNDPFPAGFFDNDPDGNPFAKAPIVVCKRGDIARVTKAVNAAAGGAGGFILWNSSSADTLANDAYAIPGIQIDYYAYKGHYTQSYYGLEDWLDEGDNHELTITASTVSSSMGDADYVADFSSRGPNLANPDVMSPSLAAPGVSVYAAYADEMPFTAAPLPADYAAISGTSMAAPHVAGAMALLAQAHTDWSPAMIQSALMTTASLDGVTRSRDAHPYDPVSAGYSDAGSGVINVSRANNAGLLLDETGANYRAANPRNGGNVTTLNMPFMYSDSCEGSCSWMRTFTATTDGTWDVSAEPLAMDGAQMLQLQVSPASFTLKKGETQAISVTAKVLEVEAIGADSSQIQLLGRVDLKPRSESLPDQYLPVGVRYGADGMPREVSGQIHRQQGHTLTPSLMTDEIQSLNSEVSGMTKGQRFEFDLKFAEKRMYMGNDEHGPVTRAKIDADPGAEIIFFDVPEGTTRIVWEVQHVEAKHAYTSLDLGMDVNGDDEIQWIDEALCYSYTDAGDYCAVNNPEPGRYWAIAANWKFDYEDYDNLADRFVMSLGIVTAADEANMTVEGPESTDGLTPYQLQLNYDLPGAAEGEIYYGTVSVGSDMYNADNLGEFAVKLEHMGSDIEVNASQTAAAAGDIIDFHVALAPNLLAGERPFNLTTTLPEGLTLLEDSITIGGVANYAEGLTVDGGKIMIDSTQPSSQDMPRHYVFTTNHDDPMCGVPYGDNPAFYDLNQYPNTPMGITGYPNQTLIIPLAANGLPHVPLYGNPEKYAQDTLAISPFGYVQFDPMPDFFNWPTPFVDSFQGFPDTMVAPLWRGDVLMPNQMLDWATGKYINAVFGVVTNKHYIFQWEGGEEYMHFFSGNDNPDPDAYFNIQTVISTEINFEPGDYEVIYAYDQLNTYNDHLGSIGLHGYWGERGAFGPQFGYENDGFAFNDVNTKISNGTVVCADYRGPEQTRLDLRFQARVSADAVGADNMLMVESQFADSEMVSVDYAVNAPSNIQLADIADITIDENGTAADITVIYNDLKGTQNGIEVTGENISATINGTASGSTIDVVPNADWHGETMVTVSVYDMAYPSDKASTSFMLTVMSDGVEKGCTDSTATNFDANANQNDGSCSYPAEPAPEPETSGGSSSGSLGWALLALLAMAARRNIRH